MVLDRLRAWDWGIGVSEFRVKPWGFCNKSGGF